METLLVSQMSISEKLAIFGDFTIFTVGLCQTGLYDILHNKGPYTVFAPTDEAFGQLPFEKRKHLFKPENASILLPILRHLIVPEMIPAEKIAGSMVLETLNGNLTVHNNHGRILVERASVTVQDIDCFNGIAHGIDFVVMP